MSVDKDLLSDSSCFSNMPQFIITHKSSDYHKIIIMQMFWKVPLCNINTNPTKEMIRL